MLWYVSTYVPASLIINAIVSLDGQADGRRSEAISWAAPAGTKQSKAKAISLGKRGAQTSARPQTKQDNFPLDNCQEDKYQGRQVPALALVQRELVC